MIRQIFEDTIIRGRTTYSILPNQNIAASKNISVIPVSNLHLLILQNTIGTLVTNLTGGFDGMPLMVLGDTHTTFKNNANIVTSTGADKLLNKLIYLFVCYQNVWYEKA